MVDAPILHFALILLHFAFISVAIAQDADVLSAREEAALRAAAEAVADSVVQIRTIGGLDSIDDTQLATGPTTGLVISPDGYIISSAFNFVQRPSSILVTLASGKQTPAELIATDHSRMLVLLKAGGVGTLAVPEFAPRDEIQPGQWAVAVGRTFRADRTNISVGIVSAVNRMHGKVLQTDAAVSTANYGGPLVDIRGRVLGVLVPMAPQSTSEVAGVEWYDSGIGFAVPLSAIGDAMERMKRGEDQYTGLLGISMSGRRPMTSPPELAAVRPDSPAGKAGLKKGDRIIEIDGRPIKTQSELRMAMGSRYAGEAVRVSALRGDERLEKTVTLVGKMLPFRHAFLGILPLRPVAAANADDDNQEPPGDADAKPAASDKGQGEKNEDQSGTEDESAGVIVRMVYSGSPAAEARIQPGDCITKINAAGIKDIATAIAEMNNIAPGDAVNVTLVRGEETLDLTLTTSRLPTSVPADLPTAYEEAADSDTGGRAAVGASGETRDLKLSAMPQNCKVYVPAAHASGRPHGLLLWLHAPGESDPEAVIKEWQPICDRDGLVLVVPTAEDVKQWDRTELEYLGRLAQRAVRQYRPDPRRVVAFGQGGGGGMAYLLALPNRQVFTGIAATSAPLPRQIQVPDSEPAQRLAIFAGLGADALTADISQGLKKLSDAGYPVTPVSETNPGGALTDSQRNELARWIDTLDRF
jgi:serine protease Do